MADTKLTALTAATSAASSDILYLVANPGTTPVSRKITVGNLSPAILDLSGGMLSDWDDFLSSQNLGGTWYASKLGWYPGIIRVSVTADGVFYQAGDGTGVSPNLVPAETFDQYFVVRPINATNVYYRVGNGDSTGNPSSNGIYIECLAADSNWFLVTRSGGTQTRVDTGVARSANTWYQFRIRRIDASTIGGTVNAGTEVTSTTNVPTAVLTPQFGLGASSGTQSLDIDFYSIRITGLTRY
jgi:hypothetical protein